MSDERGQMEASAALQPAAPHSPRMRTLLICDLADSTALVERLGDGPAAELIRRHDRIARDLLQRFRGREIDKTDGFLLLFDRPVEAVGFALAYQRALHSLGRDAQQTLRARVGIHVGEVVLWENSAAEIAAGAKPVEVEGLAKPVVARLMALALPGQIVLSGVAFTIAQRAEKELEASAPLRWLTHGRYHFKGVPAPMLVHEVGEAGFAPLQAPPSSAKAVRDVPLWRKPGVLALEVIAVIAAIAIPLALSLRAPPAIAFGERDWVVMGELRNLTGETLLDDSLETAFRISLEQSRHVNVLPDLKLRDALARMQRPPETAIDRAVASEIALREGARAVIMPTVAEVGGRVRVSAEVVDPNTQTTVYAESADGVGAESTLDSIDSVTQELRAKLGEAMAAIEQDSAPLPKVTSANLDALRAYALGYKAYMNSDFSGARRLYEQALALDPEFAQAKVGIARILIAGDEYAAARPLLEQALTHRDRLAAREILYTEAFQAAVEYRPDYLDRWKNLIAVYPDFHPSYYNYAMYATTHELRYAEAEKVARGGLDTKNPGYGSVVYYLGMMQLAQEDYAGTLDRLGQARTLGQEGSGRMWARYHGARRNFAEAERAILGFRKTGLASNDVLEKLTIAAVRADQGKFPDAHLILREGRAAAREVGPMHVRIFALADAALSERTQPRESFLRTLRQLFDEERVHVHSEDATSRAHAAFALAWAAGAAARSAEALVSAEALREARAALGDLHYPIARQLTDGAEAELLLRTADVARARDLLDDLEPELMLLSVRATRMEALAAAGETDQAIAEATHLAKARGRAYVEFGSYGALHARNVTDANLSWLRVAEIAASAGRREQARAALAQMPFDVEGPLPEPIAVRVARVHDALRE